MKADPAAACRFFTAEDACRLALQAYYAATHRIEPPQGEPWAIDGEPYATAQDFAGVFVGEMQARVGLLGLHRLGTFCATASDWDLLGLAHPLAPEKIAPLLAQRQAENAEDGCDIFGFELHDLPPVENGLHNGFASLSESHG